MKTRILTIVLLLAVSVAVGLSKDNETKLNGNAKKNMMCCLNCDNLGVKKSAIYFAGLYKVQEALIPLMKILHNDQDEETRILAALALYHLDSERGIYAVKGASSTDDSEKVRIKCSIIYHSYKYNKPENLIFTNTSDQQEYN